MEFCLMQLKNINKIYKNLQIITQMAKIKSNFPKNYQKLKKIKEKIIPTTTTEDIINKVLETNKI